MPVMQQGRALASQFGVTVSDTSGYGVGGGDAAFAVGQTIFVRFATRFPKGSVINSATLTFNMAVKNTGTTQNASHEVRGDYSGDSPLLVPGRLEAVLRPKTATAVPWLATWTANPPDAGAVMNVIDVKAIVTELVNKSDFMNGGYMTFMIKCTNENGSDMSVRLNNAFAPAPTLAVDFTPPASDVFYTYNRCENSELNTKLEGLETVAAFEYPGWSQNGFFGAFVDPASVNAGTIARDASFTRVPGVPTLRFTCGTPPSPNDKLTGPMGAVSVLPGEWFTFAGWIYIPASTPTLDYVMVGDVYNSFQNIAGLPRGAWRPFCSPPLQNTTNAPVTRWPAVGIRPYVAGYQYWISEPAFYILPDNIRQMPFNGITPEKPYIDHQSTNSNMQSTRAWTPRRKMLVNGALKPTPTWVRRTDVTTSIVELCEPVKGGPQVGQLPAGVTVGGLPAGQTVTEL